MKTLHIAAAETIRPGEIKNLIEKLTGPLLSSMDVEPNVEGVPWEKLWDYIHSCSISQTGLDVSEVGNTWISSLVNTAAVRPFSVKETADILGQGMFFDVLQKQTSWDGQTWAIPWMADTRVIYYRRSMLKAAGVDEGRAFSTIENMNETMERLLEGGLHGWAAPTFSNNNSIYLLAPWIWAEGGDFVSRDKKRTAFCEPSAVKGMLAYFNLAKYIPHEFHSFDDVATAFKSKQVAAILDGPWVLADLHKEKSLNIDFDDVGLTLPPGPSFVGGSNLVIWQHAGDKTDAALLLIKLLSTPEIHYQINKAKKLLPVRQESFLLQPYSSDPAYRVFMSALKTGRHMPAITAWAPLESSLLKAFGMVWEVSKHNGFQVTEANLMRYLEPLAKRFDNMLAMF
jgi:multiple sugar transport system substrate-binding protein